MVTLQLNQIKVLPGQTVILKEIYWPKFEAILEALGDHRSSRIAYSKGTLEITTPLPEHEVIKGIVSDVVKILLEELNINCEVFGSTTFKREDLDKGIEPDESFYIKNSDKMMGRDRIDLTLDPAPDLVIEIEVTSPTQLDIYQSLGVPELWQVKNRQLQINILENGQYIDSKTSPTFPNLSIIERVNYTLKQAYSMGRSPALREFRQWIKQQIKE